MAGPIIVKVSRKTHKKCIKCRQWKKKDGEFGKHADNDDGRQVICYACKNKAAKGDRARNVKDRIRHHTATRVTTQLGDAAPPHLIRDLEKYLGYKISALVKHLRKDLKEREGEKRSLKDALNEGYHIDHIRPLRLYQVVAPKYISEGVGDGENLDAELDVEDAVDWDCFRDCWRMENLSAIPAGENLRKGGRFDPDDAHTSDPEASLGATDKPEEA